MSAAKVKRAPSPSQARGRVHVSLALRPDQLARLEQIRDWAATDPALIALTTRTVGLQTAVLYAVAHMLRNPPGHVGGQG
jgi:hypothetical protein